MMRKFLAVNKWLARVGLCVAMSVGTARAQTLTSAPTNSTLQVSVGAQALGMGTAAAGTDAVAKVSFVGNFSLRSDTVVVPSASFKGEFAGGQYNLPTSIFAKTNLSALQLYINAGVGPESPAAGVTHVGTLAGGGANWLLANNVIVNLIEVDWMHAPGYTPPGVLGPHANQPKVSGGLSLYF